MIKKAFFHFLFCLYVFNCTTLKFQHPEYSKNIDRYPVVLEKIEPVYPAGAREKGLQGFVNLYLLITKEGAVKQVKIAKSSGHSVLDAAAIDYAKQLMFKPAITKGEPIDIWSTWTVNYNLKPIEPDISVDEYIRQIKELRVCVNQATGNKRNKILKQMLSIDHSFLIKVGDKHTWQYRLYIQHLLAPEVFQRWDVYWNHFPLTFVVYYDFIHRYRDDHIASDAFNSFIKQLRYDMEHSRHIAIQSPESKVKLLMLQKDISILLSEEFPEFIPNDLKEEIKEFQ